MEVYELAQIKGRFFVPENKKGPRYTQPSLKGEGSPLDYADEDADYADEDADYAD